MTKMASMLVLGFVLTLLACQSGGGNDPAQGVDTSGAPVTATQNDPATSQEGPTQAANTSEDNLISIDDAGGAAAYGVDKFRKMSLEAAQQIPALSEVQVNQKDCILSMSYNYEGQRHIWEVPLYLMSAGTIKPMREDDYGNPTFRLLALDGQAVVKYNLDGVEEVQTYFQPVFHDLPGTSEAIIAMMKMVEACQEVAPAE